METRWRIELLGGLRAIQGDRVISRFRSQKTGGLLAYLAYHCRSTHQREALIELLWPGRDPAASRDGLSTELSWLRHQLEPPLVESSGLRVESASDAGPSKLSTRNAQLSTVIVADRASVRL